MPDLDQLCLFELKSSETLYLAQLFWIFKICFSNRFSPYSYQLHMNHIKSWEWINSEEFIKEIERQENRSMFGNNSFDFNLPIFFFWDFSEIFSEFRSFATMTTSRQLILLFFVFLKLNAYLYFNHNKFCSESLITK